jgi:hypothetical protein
MTMSRILEATTRLMYVQGVGVTTLDDVVRASGTSKSQFYRHFPDKQALVIESPNSWPGAAQILPPDEDVATTELYGVVDAALDGLPACPAGRAAVIGRW